MINGDMHITIYCCECPCSYDFCYHCDLYQNRKHSQDTIAIHVASLKGAPESAGHGLSYGVRAACNPIHAAVQSKVLLLLQPLWPPAPSLSREKHPFPPSTTGRPIPLPHTPERMSPIMHEHVDTQIRVRMCACIDTNTRMLTEEAGPPLAFC